MGNGVLDVGIKKKVSVYSEHISGNLAELQRIWDLKEQGKIGGRKK